MANLYANLSKIRFLRKNYSLKFLFVAFIGIHIPLITIVIIGIIDNFTSTSLGLLISALVATLVASALTLYFLNKLLWPLHEAKKALGLYLSQRQLPTLPTQYVDEAGLLLKELQLTIEQLDYLINEKKDVITLLSHDIRTPFNQILSITNEMIAGYDKELTHQYAQSIKDISVKNLLILNDILKLLKTEQLEESERTAIELNDLVHSASDHLSSSATEKSISVIITDADAPVFIFANKVLLTEAISNLINNAIKFSYPGTAIQVRVWTEKRMASISVKDQGTGIRKEDMQKIFHRFTSAGKTGTNGEHSSGVGLYLSRKIIQKLGGNLTASSEGKNKGATFTASLPISNSVVQPNLIYESHLKNEN